jgi:ABC-type Mn2+/Zn2+ transport system permease subunit
MEKIQTIIVLAILAAAAAYFCLLIYRKFRAFGFKPGCATDCGCNDSAK